MASIFAIFFYFIAYSIILARYSILCPLSSLMSSLNYTELIYFYTEMHDNRLQSEDNQILDVKSYHSLFSKLSFFYFIAVLLKRHTKRLSIILVCKIAAH